MGVKPGCLKTELLHSGGGFDDDISNYIKESVKRSLIIEILRNDPFKGADYTNSEHAQKNTS